MWKWAVVLLVAALLFPYCLERTQEKGYDFPIYYRAGQGDISPDFNRGAYVYSHKTAPIFGPLSRLPYPLAFGVFYVATWASLIALYRRLGSRLRAFPVLGASCAIIGGGAAFIILRCGNVTGMLAILVTTPVGAVLAMCVKPYLGAFVLLHAAIICARSTAPKIPSSQGESDLLG
jgi:hypothetical protein